MTIIMNPGTHADHSATLENADEIAARILEDIEEAESIEYTPGSDHDGWFRFYVSAGDKSVQVDIPGDEPDVVCESMPFKSRRLYVDGSSWLYGFALSAIARRLGLED